MQRRNVTPNHPHAMTAKLNALAALITADRLAEYQRNGYTVGIANGKHVAKVTMGKKFAKIDANNSGFLMVDIESGEIFGVKAYGVVHRGHRYGTLDTMTEWNFGPYAPQHVGPRTVTAETLAAAAATVPAPKPVPVGAKFAVGQVLRCHSSCDYDTVYEATVQAVTEKTVTLSGDCHGSGVCKIHTDQHDGRQYCYPHGRYSMAAIYYAPEPAPEPAPEAEPANVLQFSPALAAP